MGREELLFTTQTDTQTDITRNNTCFTQHSRVRIKVNDDDVDDDDKNAVDDDPRRQ